MSRHEFHRAMSVLEKYIRGCSKYWAKNVNNDMETDEIRPVLINAFHMLRTCALLLHPVAPEGCQIVTEYLTTGESLFDWKRCFETLYDLLDLSEDGELKFLEPRVDFFAKHPSQY